MAKKLIVSLSPHVHGRDSVQRNMYGVCIALIPALLTSLYFFGLGAAIVLATSVAACVFWEWGYRKLLKKPQSIGDLSAVVTGMLLAFVCPPTLPYWMIIIGAFFAIVVVKQLYGGIGCNFLNPALAGRAALLASYAGAMTTWLPAGTKAAITPMDWAAMVLICFVLPAVLSVLFCEIERKLGWIKEGDLKLN